MAGECFLVETKRIEKAIFSQPGVFLRIQAFFNKVFQEGCDGGGLRWEATQAARGGNHLQVPALPRCRIFCLR